MVKLTATDVARNLSAILGRVSKGERVEVVRNGTTVAVISPAEVRTISPTQLADLLEAMPPIDNAFLGDVERIRREVDPPEEPWPS